VPRQGPHYLVDWRPPKQQPLIGSRRLSPVKMRADLRSIGPACEKPNGSKDRTGSSKRLIDCNDQTGLVGISQSTNAVTRMLSYDLHLLCIQKNTHAKV
jgi:hypothetical protein